MKILLVVLAISAATGQVAGQTLSGILCQLFLGDIPLCPASSCKEIADTSLWRPPHGLHWLTDGQNKSQAYCVETISPSKSRGWMRVGYISSGSGCPSDLGQLTAGGRKLCAKRVNIGCSSVFFPSHGISYSKVCGRVYGYQKDTPDGFRRLNYCPGCTIDQPYVDGVSITHGSPRQHIWSLGAGHNSNSCPCGDGASLPHFPSFVGQDYFCDIEDRNSYTYDSQLWDGYSCRYDGERCCEKANWFCKDLPQSTTDDIEFRVCTDERRANEDVYIEYAEIYVQ